MFTYGCGGAKSAASSGGASSSGASSGGVQISNEVDSPADMSVGDLIMTQFSSGSSAEFDFSGADESSKYYLAVGSLSDDYGTHSVILQSSLSELDARSNAEAVYEDAEWESWTLQDAFSQRLRDVEMALALDPDVEMADNEEEVGFLGLRAAINPAVSEGDTEEFRVLNSLSSLSSYATVTAEAKCITDNVVFYVDTEIDETNPDDFTQADVDILCANFEEQVVLERSWFGSESDVNNDGKVAVLITPQVNRLGSMGGGIITGFFLASDLFDRNVANPVSNEREIVYALSPDSQGVYGTVLPKNFTFDNFLTAVLPHELQHVISYNQNVFVSGHASEENWLNEGLSHLTEDLVGYGQENYSRVGVFFNYPSYYSLAASGSPGLGERGASYLFMRFLYEQHPDPDQFLWDLYHSGETGVANIEAAFDGASESFDQFGEFFMRWMAALAMTNRGITQDSRYTYEDRTWNADTERWGGICLICDADDGRGTTLTGPDMSIYSNSSFVTMYSSASRFYNVTSPPDEIAFTSTSSDTFGAVLMRRE